MTAFSLDITLFALKLALVFFVILTLAAYLVFAERKICLLYTSDAADE